GRADGVRGQSHDRLIVTRHADLVGLWSDPVDALDDGLEARVDVPLTQLIEFDDDDSALPASGVHMQAVGSEAAECDPQLERPTSTRWVVRVELPRQLAAVGSCACP